VDSVIIQIEKKQGAKNYVDFKAVTLVPQILLKILTLCLQTKAGGCLGPDQSGFRKGCGTCDVMAARRVMCERSLENHNKVYIC